MYESTPDLCATTPYPHRFGVAWELLKKIRPSRTLTSKVVPPQRVAEAFKALDEQAAATLAVLIDYDLESRTGVR